MRDRIGRRVLSEILRYQLARSLGRLGVSTRLSGRAADAQAAYEHDITLYRRNGEISFGLPANPSELVFQRRDSITAYLYLFSHCADDVEVISGVCGDGNYPSAARFAPSSRSPQVIAIPDRYFILQDGFSRERQMAERSSHAWTERSTELVWRGGANGAGIHPQVPEDALNPRVMQRIRLCMLLKSAPNTDARISSSIDRNLPLSQLAPLGIVGPERSEHEWLSDRYAIDIDGWTNAWSNLMVRMHFGCCVLKVASADGYRQWWYDRLVPWEHYVPVAADMSDIVERIDWVRSHDREAEAIALRGQALVRSMTLASETAIGARIITENWRVT